MSCPNQSGINPDERGKRCLLLDEITETVIIGSGDSVASFDVTALLEAHKRSGAKATMALWELKTCPFGIVGIRTC